MIDATTIPFLQTRPRPLAAERSPAEAPERLSDEELVRLIRRSSDDATGELLGILFGRYSGRVSSWCRRFCGDPDLAADLAQEVFLRTQQRLHTFRMKSSFSTWLYTVTRSVAINGSKAERRRSADVSLDADLSIRPVDGAPGAAAWAAERQIAARLRQAMRDELDPLEAKVLYLHFVDGMTLPAITGLLGLENKSGAKAYIVSAKRKLHRRFGPWLREQSGALTGRRQPARADLPAGVAQP